MLAMTLHPDAQTKGQEEIDRIVSKDRLPTLEDRPSLPYIEAIYREVMRLHPPGPLGKDNPNNSTSDISEKLYFQESHIV